MAEEEEGGVRRRDSSRLRAVRISIADPVSYTIPYDRSLARALARRGHEVDLFTASFLFAELPPPDGYRQHDVFFTRSARVLRGNPRSRLRFLVKGLEYVPSARRLQKEISRLDPDVLHVQWLGLPRYDLRWLEAAQRERPVVFTAHDVLPRRTADKLDLWRRVFSTVDRVVVHGARAVEQLAALGVDRAKIVRIPHPVFTPVARDRTAAGVDAPLLRAHPPVEGARPPYPRAAGDRGAGAGRPSRRGRRPDRAR